MKLVKNKISLTELQKMSKRLYGDLVKAVVDIEKNIMVVDAELHADEEKLLLEQGSKQENLWGINIYPFNHGQDFLEYDSMINLRPSQGNHSRGVDNPEIRKKIKTIVNGLIENGIPT